MKLLIRFTNQVFVKTKNTPHTRNIGIIYSCFGLLVYVDRVWLSFFVFLIAKNIFTLFVIYLLLEMK